MPHVAAVALVGAPVRANLTAARQPGKAPEGGRPIATDRPAQEVDDGVDDALAGMLFRRFELDGPEQGVGDEWQSSALGASAVPQGARLPEGQADRQIVELATWS